MSDAGASGASKSKAVSKVTKTDVGEGKKRFEVKKVINLVR